VGRATDAGHQRIVLLGGAFLMAGAGAGLIFWSSSLELLLLWNVVLGLGHLMGVIGQQSRIAEGESGRLDAAFGLYTFAGSAGQAVGPLLITVFGGGRVVPDTRALFLAYTGSAIVMLALTVPLVLRSRYPGRAAAGRRDVPRGGLKSAFTRTTRESRGKLFGAMVVSAMVLGAVDLIAVYLPALGVERGIPAAVVGILLSVRAGATMASRLYLGPLVARFGRSWLIVLSTAVSALAVGALAAPLNLWVLAGVLVVAGVALGIGQPLTMTVISLEAPAGTRGTWLALRLSANRLGQSAIPAGVGLVAAAAGVAGVFGVTAAGLAVVAAGSG
jgi:MFS family permease